MKLGPSNTDMPSRFDGRGSQWSDSPTAGWSEARTDGPSDKGTTTEGNTGIRWREPQRLR